MMMITEDGYKLFYLIMISTMTAPLVKCNNSGSSGEGEGGEANSSSIGIPEGRALFSPRVEYNEWMPVGRGDPLKNDPTYDYSPPTLDHVKYWGDAKNKEKKEILLLGVPSKRQSHRIENKHNFIRRSYYPHQLPTRLMPPPLQTIPPPPKAPPIQPINFHNNYNYNTYKTNNGWSYNDVKSDESLNFVSFTHAERQTAAPPRTPIQKPLPTINNENNQNSPERKPWLQALLQKEATKTITTEYDIKPAQSTFESHSPILGTAMVTDSFMATSENPSQSSPSSVLPPELPPFVPTTTTTTTTTTIFQPTIPPTSAMTTDSLFSHYKQPIKPLQGPMYLIIEGHSKVKTYGLNDNETVLASLHAPKIVPVSTTEDVIIKHVVAEDEDGDTAKIEHLPLEKSVKNSTEESSPIKNLLNFLDTSFGNFFLNEVEQSQNDTNYKNKQANSSATHNSRNKIMVQFKPDRSENHPNVTEIEDELREGRQIFDYDELPESELKYLEEGYYQATTIAEPKNYEISIENEQYSTETT